MSDNLDKVIRGAITSAIGSGDWLSVKDEDRLEEGSLQGLDIDDCEITYGECASPEEFEVTVSGLGTVFHKDGDGREEDVEQDVTVTAKITISVESESGDGRFAAKATAEITHVEIDS